MPVRADIFDTPVRLPTSFDPLAVARQNIAMHGTRLAFQDRVGVVDFGQPSRAPRFALVDLERGSVNWFPVTHGRGSDPQHDGWLKKFSNRPGSLATSRGAFLTADYYWGANGSSMRLKGLEVDNDNAEARAIVVHGAWYAEPTMIGEYGKLGRSEGCFVFGADLLPEILYKLGPGRMIVADKFTDLLPPPAPILSPLADPASIEIAANGVPLP